MMSLKDGPAQGAYAVSRAPDYLRAVVDVVNYKTDVLDQLEDRPTAHEEVHVYRRIAGPIGRVSMMLANPRRCVMSVSAEYEFMPDVDGKPFRDTEAWRAWATAQPPVPLDERR